MASVTSWKMRHILCHIQQHTTHRTLPLPAPQQSSRDVRAAGSQQLATRRQHSGSYLLSTLHYFSSAICYLLALYLQMINTNSI